MAISKREYAELLNELVCDQCDHEYCLLKELLLSMHPSERMLMQMKCIEKFKFEKSKEEDHDIGWSDAATRWVTEGHAKKFAILFNEEKKIRSLYNEIMET